MKALYVLIVGLAVMALAAGEGVEAREWSDEIRMTYAEENRIYTAYCSMEMDSNDVIHILYNIIGCQNEAYNRSQPVYQKFDNRGEPLSDPLIMEEIVDLPDSLRFRGYDLFINNDENIYLLWGADLESQEDAHVTVFDSDGELVSEDIVLGGVTAYSVNSAPEIAVDTGGNIIYAGECIDFINPGYRIFYTRYTPEGEMIDTVHIIADNWARDFYMEIDSQDNLHIVWKVHGVNQHYSVHYTKVSSDDELLIDNYSLPSIIGREDELHIGDFKLDNSDAPLFLLSDAEDYIYRTYLVKFTDDPDTCFIKYLGITGNLEKGFIDIDSLNNIHTIATFDNETLNHNLDFIGYTKLDENGEIIDSLQIIHDASMRGEERRRANWTKLIFVFASNDGTISVIWADDRHATNYTLGQEFYMRYSANDNSIFNPPQIDPQVSMFQLIPNYPNPFNAATRIAYAVPTTGHVRLSVYDISGRIMGTLVDENVTAGSHVCEFDGCELAAGFYFVRLEAGETVLTRKAVMVK